ncbi:MAG: hypothetical protein J2P18_05155 [Nocardia sp.]|nr:hypothetical protein [Nocardia sp.]
MTEPNKPTRAIALLHSDHDPTTLEELTLKHQLQIVYTVHTDTVPALATLIAVQYAGEHAADAVVIPHLETLEPGTPWLRITHTADLITGTQQYPAWPTITKQAGRHQ